MFRNQIFLFYLGFLASCNNTELKKDAVEGFSKLDIAEHWTLQLPPGVTIERLDSFVAETKKITFSDDSLFLRYSVGFEQSFRKSDCSFSAIAKRMESGGDDICQGSGLIHIYYSPIVNRTTQIAGWRGDWVEGHRRFVLYMVSDCKSEEFINMQFERVHPSRYKLIEQIINSLEFREYK